MGAFCIFPGVYSLKRKINISMGDLIIVKHTHVLVPVHVPVSESVCSREPPPSFACLERTSIITITAL